MAWLTFSLPSNTLYGAITADEERALAAPTEPSAKAKLEPRSKLLAETRASLTSTMAQVTLQENTQYELKTQVLDLQYRKAGWWAEASMILKEVIEISRCLCSQWGYCSQGTHKTQGSDGAQQPVTDRQPGRRMVGRPAGDNSAYGKVFTSLTVQQHFWCHFLKN